MVCRVHISKHALRKRGDQTNKELLHRSAEMNERRPLSLTFLGGGNPFARSILYASFRTLVQDMVIDATEGKRAS